MPSKLGRLAASHPIILITALAILSRITPWSLLHALHLFIAPFDTSGSASPTLRWDAIHFTAIATKGYEYEQQIAFQPGWPLLVRLLARMMGGEGDFSVERATRVGEVLAMTSYVGTAVMLYRYAQLPHLSSLRKYPRAELIVQTHKPHINPFIRAHHYPSLPSSPMSSGTVLGV